MDTMTTIRAGVGLAACALALVGRTLLRQRSRARPIANETPFNALIERRSQGSERQRRPGSVPDFHRPASGGPQISALESQLRNAIFSADARERLVKDALRRTGGDRAAAIRKVLDDLHTENNRWS